MHFVRHGNDGQAPVLWICRTICICVAWAQAARALPQRAGESNVSLGTASTELALSPSPSTQTPQKIRIEFSITDFGVTPSTEVSGIIPSASPQSEALSLGLIPSAPRPGGLIPSQPLPLTSSSPPPGLIPSQPPKTSSQPPGVIPSGPIPSGPIPSGPIPSGPIPSGPIPSGPIPSGPIPSGPTPSGPIPSGPMPSGPAVSQPGIIPSQTDAHSPSLTLTIDPVSTDAPVKSMPSIQSTDEPLKPIPAPTTLSTGNPDGHHEISEPNFSITAPCRGCSPVVEVPATGWDDQWHSTPVPEQQGPETPKPPKATITAGPSPIIVSPNPSGGGFVVDKTSTVMPGQTFTKGGTPIVIETSSGRTEVVIGGTYTIPLTENKPQYQDNRVTNRPLPVPITIAGQTITPNVDSQYVIASQTLIPGGPAITVDGSTISLLPSATAIVVNGVTSTLEQHFGEIYTTTALGLLTLNGEVYTANRAGRYILGPGTTLAAGGDAITVSGTTISLSPEGTAVVIQGSTSALLPATTVVTLTKSDGPSDAIGNVPQSTGDHGGAATLTVGGGLGADGWLQGMFVLMVMGFGWLTVWL